MQNVEISKFLKALVCEFEKVGTVCNLCFMLMHVFGRISVEWRNLTINSFAYRAVLAPNFVEKASLILVSVEIMCGISLIYFRPLNKSAKKGNFYQNLCPPFLELIYFYVEGSIFSNTIPDKTAVGFPLQ